MKKPIKSFVAITSIAFLLMSGTCSKTTPLASDPCAVSYEYDYSGNSWLNDEVAVYPRQIDLGGGIIDNITLLTITKHTLPGDYNYFVFWEHHSERNSLNSFGSLFNCNGDLLCSEIEFDPLSSYDATDYPACENPLSPQNINFNSPDRSWNIGSRPQTITNACNTHFNQFNNSPWINGVTSNNGSGYPSTGYELKEIYQTDLPNGNGLYEYIFKYVDGSVSNPSQHDEWYQWYGCQGNLVCEDDGDNSVNGCSNVVPRWLNSSEIIRTWSL